MAIKNNKRKQREKVMRKIVKVMIKSNKKLERGDG